MAEGSKSQAEQPPAPDSEPDADVEPVEDTTDETVWVEKGLDGAGEERDVPAEETSEPLDWLEEGEVAGE